MIYKIGTFKDGQQIAKEIFASKDLNDVERKFKEFWCETEFSELDNPADNAEQAWAFKQYSEDTNNVAVFKVNDNEDLHTYYTYHGCISKMMK